MLFGVLTAHVMDCRTHGYCTIHNMERRALPESVTLCSNSSMLFRKVANALGNRVTDWLTSLFQNNSKK